MQNLTRLHLWGKAGYPLTNEPLDFDAWNGLALINRWFEVKDLEAQSRLQAQATSGSPQPTLFQVSTD